MIEGACPKRPSPDSGGEGLKRLERMVLQRVSRGIGRDADMTVRVPEGRAWSARGVLGQDVGLCVIFVRDSRTYTTRWVKET